MEAAGAEGAAFWGAAFPRKKSHPEKMASRKNPDNTARLIKELSLSNY
jgi:hypothetical protein